METAQQDLTRSLAFINSRITAANSITEQLDQSFNAALEQNTTPDTVQNLSRHLKELNASYHAIQKLITTYNADGESEVQN